jgi:hypothetical protein
LTIHVPLKIQGKEKGHELKNTNREICSRFDTIKAGRYNPEKYTGEVTSKEAG